MATPCPAAVWSAAGACKKSGLRKSICPQKLIQFHSPCPWVKTSWGEKQCDKGKPSPRRKKSYPKAVCWKLIGSFLPFPCTVMVKPESLAGKPVPERAAWLSSFQEIRMFIFQLDSANTCSFEIVSAVWVEGLCLYLSSRHSFCRWFRKAKGSRMAEKVGLSM